MLFSVYFTEISHSLTQRTFGKIEIPHRQCSSQDGHADARRHLQQRSLCISFFWIEPSSGDELPSSNLLFRRWSPNCSVIATADNDSVCSSAVWIWWWVFLVISCARMLLQLDMWMSWNLRFFRRKREELGYWIHQFFRLKILRPLVPVANVEKSQEESKSHCRWWIRNLDCSNDEVVHFSPKSNRKNFSSCSPLKEEDAVEHSSISMRRSWCSLGGKLSSEQPRASSRHLFDSLLIPHVLHGLLVCRGSSGQFLHVKDVTKWNVTCEVVSH